MNKTKSFLSLGLILLLVCGVSAGFRWIFSNQITVTVTDYTFQNSLSIDNETPMLYENITFNGTLFYTNGSRVGADHQIFLFQNDTKIPEAYDFTDVKGDFTITYNVTELGTFTFKVGFDP